MGKSPEPENKSNKTKVESLFPILLVAIAIPTALFFWFGNLLLKSLTNNEEESEHIPPTRWLASTIIPLAFTGWGLHKKSLDKTGAIFGLLVGFILTISSYCFFSCLLTFFITSSKATKFRSHQKRNLEDDFKEGGQRNWVQVICNGGMATILALLYMLDYGCGELPISFKDHYRESWLSVGILGSFACCNGDTWASELGTVFGGSPFLITTRKKVPRGTNGGVTPGGLLFSGLGGLTIGITYYLSLLYCIDEHVRSYSPPQWPVIIIGAIAGLLGSLIDSFLGATLQYSGLDPTRGCIVENPGPNIKHISGKRILDNHSVNLLSTVLMGFLTPKIANIVWL